MIKAPISAIVVCYNEASMLERCIQSLAFCNEIIVIDLGSKDDSRHLAETLGAKVIGHPWVPIGEMARESGSAVASNDWLLIIDPDEEITSTLAGDITQAVADDDSKAGTMSVPWFNYFKGRPLKGTVWGGGARRKLVLMHKQRATLVKKVHSDFFTLLPGYHDVAIPAQSGNWLNHYWIRSWTEFSEKHHRYLKLEGEARSARGERFRWRRLVRALPYCFWESFIIRRGYLDGLVGLELSVAWTWYNCAALLALRRYQHKPAQNTT